MYRKTVMILALTSFTAGCDLSDTIRNWGVRHRQSRTEEIDQRELERLRTDFKLSEEKARQLHKNIQELVQEKALHGQISYKIAKALMNDGRFDAADPYFRGAIEGKLPDAVSSASVQLEEARQFYDRALRNQKPNPELLFDAGLCYANASRAFGWESNRLDTAVFLFRAVAELKPDDHRPKYQLALIYGKGPDTHRNTELAVELLDEILLKEDQNIPVRFAKANILTEAGNAQAAADEYRNIQMVIEDLYKKKVLRGNINQNRQYKQAKENEEKLIICIENRPGCEIAL